MVNLEDSCRAVAECEQPVLLVVFWCQGSVEQGVLQVALQEVLEGFTPAAC